MQSCICASTSSEVALLVFKSHGDPGHVLSYDAFLDANKAHWLANEVRQFWKRVLKRIDVTSRTLVTLVEPGSCFVGTLAELVFAADRSYMLIGSRQGDNRPPPSLQLSAMNFGPYPMSHGLTRLQSRFQADPDDLDARGSQDRQDARCGASGRTRPRHLRARRHRLGRRDPRVLRGARRFSPDSLTGMEANLRFVGPETMESKIFSRLTAWQNWIFQRPNAVGEDGALRRYGTGQKPKFDMTRVSCPGRAAARSDAAQNRDPQRLPMVPALRRTASRCIASGTGTRRRHDMNIMNVDYSTKIPNNVNLSEDRQVLKALEGWHPGYIDWWNEWAPTASSSRWSICARPYSRRSAGLGQVRLREDARLSLGHSACAAGREPQDSLRRAFWRAGLAGGARRISRHAAPADRDPGRHRAGLRRAAAPSRQDRALALRPAQSVPGQCRGGPSSLGDGLSPAEIFWPRRPRGGRRVAAPPLRRRR